MNLKGTINEIEKMHESGVIGLYAIGGAVGASVYLEPGWEDEARRSQGS